MKTILGLFQPFYRIPPSSPFFPAKLCIEFSSCFRKEKQMWSICLAAPGYMLNFHTSFHNKEDVYHTCFRKFAFKLFYNDFFVFLLVFALNLLWSGCAIIHSGSLSFNSSWHVLRSYYYIRVETRVLGVLNLIMLAQRSGHLSCINSIV